MQIIWRHLRLPERSEVLGCSQQSSALLKSGDHDRNPSRSTRLVLTTFPEHRADEESFCSLSGPTPQRAAPGRQTGKYLAGPKRRAVRSEGASLPVIVRTHARLCPHYTFVRCCIFL